MSGTRLVLAAVLLLLAGCGGEGGTSQGQTPSAPPSGSPSAPVAPPETEAAQVARALEAQGQLPPFPIAAPIFDNPLLDGSGVMIDERNNTYNPTLISRLALDRYAKWRKGQSSPTENYLDTARKQADWLAANIECRNGVGVWRYQFPASFGAEPGWVSGFGNAHAVVALLIMSRFINDPERYIEPALCGIGAFDADVAEGGVKTTLETGGKWYEEYAVPSRPGVMNGHVFALAGLHYACKYGSVQKACGLFDQGVFALRSRLPMYDAGFTSRYSLIESNFASDGYATLHHGVLTWIHSVTGDPEFKKYADLFLDYEAETFKFTAAHTADPETHGPDRLTDGNFFFGYWSTSRLPATLDFDMGSKQRVRAVAVAFLGDEPLPVRYAIVDEQTGVAGGFIDLPAPEKVVRHEIAGEKTTVGIFPVGVDAKRMLLRFPAPVAGTQAIAVREINILH